MKEQYEAVSLEVILLSGAEIVLESPNNPDNYTKEEFNF